MGTLWSEILQWTLALAGLWLVSGTLLNFSSHPHWYIRGWDFPRVTTAVLALIVAAAWAWICEWHWWDWAFLGSLAGVVAVQVWNIYPYTPLAGEQVLRSEHQDAQTEPLRTSIRLVGSEMCIRDSPCMLWCSATQ